MNCPNCKVGTIKDGKYICKSDGYHIADSNGDVLFILKHDDIPSDDAGTSAIVMIFFRALDLGEFVSSLGERAVRNFFLLPPAGGTN